jgi:hypothetical protein
MIRKSASAAASVMREREKMVSNAGAVVRLLLTPSTRMPNAWQR